MDINKLQVNSKIIGGYFSSEQIDLLSIIQCKDNHELIYFILHCDQIKNSFSKKNIDYLKTLSLDKFKEIVFKSYQDTMVPHDSNKLLTIENKLKHCGIHKDDIQKIKDNISLSNIIPWIKDYIMKNYPNNYQDIFTMSHHFISTERDQLKEENIYNELSLLNSNLGLFNTMLIGSGRIYNVINEFYDSSDKKYDFYFAKRDLDFAYKNNKQVRYHSLLVKEDKLFNKKSKKEILEMIEDYVKESIDFINNYNENYHIKINNQDLPIINAIDLFNEIISFEKNDKGEYYNIWEEKYDITIDDILNAFDYAYKNKPKGIVFLYNEPFLENDERRKKVFSILNEINTKRPGLLDTLGSQMHITIGEDENKIERCFEDFNKLQKATGIHIQITEFDMSLNKKDALRLFDSNSDVTLKEIYLFKQKSLLSISSIINNSGIILDGITYWSLTDGIDSNLERIRTELLSNGIISNINQIPTVYGGLLSTRKEVNG